MKTVLIKFPSVIEMIDFEITIQPCDIKINTKNNTITGTLTEAEIELAKSGFNAEITEIGN